MNMDGKIAPYPLRFQPQFKERVWGARELERYGFAMPDGRIGEAWVMGEHPNGTTAVVGGPCDGMGLDAVRERFGAEWLGTRGISAKTGRFPLLVKLLDCSDWLSVQVHPHDDDPRLGAGELGKTEMWYVLDAKPGAKIICGLRDGVNQAELAQAVADNRLLECLREVDVVVGDTFYIPAGTVHALGAGVLVAEIQQNSDTTYRLYDFGRVGLDGLPRELHIEDSLRVISYDQTSASYGKTPVSASNVWLELARSEYFVVEKGCVEGIWALLTSSVSFQILLVCAGDGCVEWHGGSVPLSAGACYLLPASLGAYSLKGSAMTVLRSYVP
jgi:mannose-6-phosphate isomerase